MSFPDEDDFIYQLKSVIPARSPTFIYIQDSFTTGRTRSILHSVLTSLAQEVSSNSESLAFVFVDCVACFTQKLLFDNILNSLEKLCHCRLDQTASDILTGHRNDSLDGFLESVRLLFSEPGSSSATSRSGRGHGPSKVVLVFERAERLRETLLKIVVPLTRLRELTGRNVTTVFLADVEWEHMTPLPGSFPDPYRITIEPLDKQEIIETICRSFPCESSPESITSYNSSLRPLFFHFVETVYNVCAPFTMDHKELGYIVAARWPGFVSPVLEDWKRQTNGPYLGPSEEGRIRLMRLFSPSLTHAIESLYPRSMEASEWGVANSFPPGFCFSQSLGKQLPSSIVSSSDSQDTTPKLSDMSIFIMLAAFLASYNPAKTDYRIFGRGADDRLRRRRKGGGARKTGPGAVAKLPQRLIGPMAFPYDRLVAILCTLLREYHESKEVEHAFQDNSGLKAEVDVYRVQTSASIRELVSLRLLHRATVQEKFETPSFKCGIGYDQALSLARKLGMPLNELIWNTN